MAKPTNQAQSGKRTVFFLGDTADALATGNEIGWQYIWCAGFDDSCLDCGGKLRVRRPAMDKMDVPCLKCGSKNRERHFHHFDGIRCDCPMGPQAYALTVQAFEIAMGGGRGGIKSETGLGITTRGNRVDNPRGVNATYLNSPNYRFLVIRKNSKDLKDWWQRAKRFYSLFGAPGKPVEFNDTDMVIKFPSGAQGIGDHLATDDAYQKYQGQEFQTIWLEEATQIPNYQSYERLRMSCRSSYPELKPLVFLTANPGGMGHTWFKARFADLGSRRVYIDPTSGLTRVFIHSTVFDNPYFIRGDANYAHQLAGIGNDNLRAQWFDGSFGTIEGQYFTEFRADHRVGEPENSCHVVKAGSQELLPYWHRWIGMDWGYSHNSAVFWACQHPDSRVHIYRELVVSRVGAEELGAMIARESLPDLVQRDGIRHLTIHLSPDAFAHKDDTNTIAEQVKAGIERIIGRNSVFLMDFDSVERFLPHDKAWASMMERKRQFKSDVSITIERADNQRVAGWMKVREFLRWKSITAAKEPDPDVIRYLAETKDSVAVREYVQQFSDQKSEVLPRLQIWSNCPVLISKIPAAQHDTTRPEDVMKIEGDDEVDCLRYTLMAATEHQNEKPRSFYVADRVAEVIARLPGLSLHGQHMVEMKANEDYKKAHSPGFRGHSFARHAGRSARRLIGAR